MISNELKKIIELQNSIESDKLNYKNYDFNKVLLPALFLRDTYTKNLLIENADDEQSDLFRLLNSKKKGRKSSEKIFFLKNVEILLKAREDVLNRFKSNLFPTMSNTTPRKTSINEEYFMNENNSQQKGTGLKILTPKQMLERLTIALAQIKAGNNSESLLNEIRQIIYSLYQSKEITKKVK